MGPSTRSVLVTRSLSAKRVFILGLVIAIAVSYIGSARGYLSQRDELRRQEHALAALRGQRDAIRARLASGGTEAVAIARARDLGLVQPGEIPIRVTGLDKIPRPQPPRPAAGGGFWSWLPAL